MLEHLNWPPLQQRRKQKRFITFHKAINNRVPIEIPEYVQRPSYTGTRSHSNTYIEIRANYEQYKNSFIPRTIRDWNSLPPDLAQVSAADDFRDRMH
ncbi:hypothetical protein ACJMK2_035962 [Sinanodonta woodiana]|uniref:Uncharacterized protein n=1 Tax=Sinanodonta woodiana TaxID=1069815 RepID=A0ABD3WGW6_SINWO